MSKNIDLRLTDCLSKIKGLNSLKDNSVDLILCDLPYGKTTAPWDKVINPDKLWEQYKRIIKDHGAIVLFGNEPFSSRVRLIGNKYVKYHYDYKWVKNNKTNFPNCRQQPLHQYEDIMVFYKKQPTYNPQMIKGKKHANCGFSYHKNRASHSKYHFGIYDHCDTNLTKARYTHLYYPTNLIHFDIPKASHRYHPTQKPIKLLNFLIKTYTNKGDLVLDNTMGSGSTGVSCALTHRRFIGMELDKHFYQIAVNRIKEVYDADKLSKLNQDSTLNIIKHYYISRVLSAI